MVNNKEPGSLLTLREVALILHIHANTVRRWSNKGIIKAYRINRRGDRRFRKDEITKFVKELRTDSAHKTFSD